MAASKPPTRAIAKFLERTSAPVYIVDNEYVISYANQACADWVGVPLSELISSKCTYTSHQSKTELEEQIQGLCPPPESLEAAVHRRPISFSVSAGGKGPSDVWRDATAHPMLDSGDVPIGVLVIGEPSDREVPPTTDPIECCLGPEQLHAALREIRSVHDRLYSLESLVGTSPFAHRLRRQVESAIETNMDLLIIGPRGTGKEHLARTIHQARHQQKDIELTPIHCSIADQPIIQQTIKDIVTSRSRSDSKPADHHDWLLLLDIDQLDGAAQQEIFGFIQLPNFALRTLATTSVALTDLAQQGNFSQELAYHLSAVSVELVPLDQRQLDIPFLAQALLERENIHRDRQLSGFTKSAMQQLAEFHWPENIDQLQRVIQLAIERSSSSQITPEDFPEEFNHGLQALRIGRNVEVEIQMDQYLAEIEKELISRALRQAKNNKTKAAKLLGISRPKLIRRTQHFELEESSLGESRSMEKLDSSAFEELE